MRKLFLALAASAVAVAMFAIGGAATGANGPTQFTVAFTNATGLPANVDQMVANAGGTITERLPEIGGVSATSSSSSFAATLAKNSSVKAVAPAAMTSIGPTLNSSVFDDQVAATGGNNGNNGGTYSPAGPDPQPEPDSAGNQQWDKMRMNVSLTGSYALQRGRKEVRVFVVDTGADQLHPDVAPNLDVADSRSFVPSEPTIQDFNGHGTWTISAVGAPINGVGISGVAPGVTLVEGKVLNGAGSGQFTWLDEALIYAAQQHFDIVSASLGGYIGKCGAVSNPNTMACDHPDYILLVRATQYARANGVLPVGALGNDGFDLADNNATSAGVDAFYGYPAGTNVVEAPGETPGWVGVSATGYYNQKAHYSNYGNHAVDVSAPGGATRNYSGVPGSGAPPPPYLGVGRLIGAWSSTGNPAGAVGTHEECTDPVGTPPCGLYGYVQGTSMATPNVAGVAALIVSQYGDFTGSNGNKIHMSPTTVESILQTTANNQPCPTPNTVVQGPGFVYPTATCQGNTGYNNFFGKGIVDAVKAVTFH